MGKKTSDAFLEGTKDGKFSLSLRNIPDVCIILEEEMCKQETTETDLSTLLHKAYKTIDVLHKQMEMIKSRLDVLQEENKRLQEERDDAVNEVNKLRDSVDHRLHETISEFSLSDLQKATENFNEAHKISDGGFGSDFQGLLNNSMVVIKLPPQSLQGRLHLGEEVSILRTLKHPNLVSLVGTCSEKSALVYEFIPNYGSLEDRLACQGGSPPLTWQVRTRIIGEIYQALCFLHSNKPNPIVHGNLTLANILLDSNLGSKLSDYGISRLLIETTSHMLGYRVKYPRGTYAYMDRESMSTGEITVKSDVYSFGIIVLQLLTGKSPLNIEHDVNDVIDAESLHFIIDESAGKWPFVQAEQLAKLGLRCTKIERSMRPDLESERKLVESLVNAASLSVLPSFKHGPDHKDTPSYFICPISLEIMKNPQIAADGYTYEAEAIKRWLDMGRMTSPMTNLPLRHIEITPNHALRSAIQEWFLQHS